MTMGPREVAAAELMLFFSERTGLSSDEPQRRYLWTDAFAVCTFLGLARSTREGSFEALALRLVERVHAELGRHREDDGRHGRISGLSEAEARLHPTRGGLRIGKPLPERAMNEPFDAELEWERDGQYFHYLTKWMHALDQVARHTGQSWFNTWARELAETAHRAFVSGEPGARRMVWKVSIDLSRPLVPSMGQHDPLDGFVTCQQLQATASTFQSSVDPPRLETATKDFAEMIDRARLATDDPLGLGGLLVDVCRLGQMDADNDLLPSLLDVAALGLRLYVAQPDLRARAHHRLAFRELGLAIGLAGIAAHRDVIATHLEARRQSRDRLAELLEYVPLKGEIESFWLDPDHRRGPTWTEHMDINEVMLATSLAPEGFLDLGSAERIAEWNAACCSSSSEPMTIEPIRKGDLLDEIVDAGLEDRERAERAVRATMAALAERLTPDEACRLASVLPDELRADLADVQVEGPVRADPAELVEQVRLREGVSAGRAREEIQIVCGALGRRLSDGERHVVIRALPPEIAADFDQRPQDSPESSPPTLPSGNGRTLATGRPGSRHPIAEAAPERAHAESIARSDDPHGDTKLSTAKGLTQEREDETLSTGRPGVERSFAEANDRTAPSQR